MDSSKYHHLLTPNGDFSNRPNDLQRKSLMHMLSASTQSLDNLSYCNLLENELKNYLDQSDGVYANRLEEILNKSNRNDVPKELLRSNLSKLSQSSLLNLIRPLNCSGGVNCNKSENSSSEEFAELLEVLKDRKDPEVIESKPTYSKTFEFKTALDELKIQQIKKYGTSSLPQNGTTPANSVGQKRKVGLSRRNINSKFISPTMKCAEEVKSDEWSIGEVDERYKNIEPKMIEMIKSEIMDCGPTINWDDIAGLTFAKTTIQEAVVWPMLRPDIFTGLRKPPKGILLFGPPGTGKTLIGKCVASQSKSTFFSISASSLTSKWVGDGEKMVRALFTVARVHQPSVIFIDEIDSLLSQRSDTEHESSRRIKTEFLVQLDGATTDSEERLLVIGATNRPQELDEAARRRFVKRLYIPLPESDARLQLLQNLIQNENHQLTSADFNEIAEMSEGYSGADIKNLCSEASLGPIRSIDKSLITHISASDVRPLLRDDFITAFSRVRASVAPKDLDQYMQWDSTYGSG